MFAYVEEKVRRDDYGDLINYTDYRVEQPVFASMPPAAAAAADSGVCVCGLIDFLLGYLFCD